MPTGSPEDIAAPTPAARGANLAGLAREIESDVSALMAELLKVQPERRGARDGGASAFSGPLRRKLDLLRELVGGKESSIELSLDPTAPLGHRVPEVGRWVPPEPGADIEMLEELSDRRLLERSLVNRVHVCPDCRCCQLNFRECCPACSSLDLRLERLVHHFPCAYIGLESEFSSGNDLVCPKCTQKLRQLGRDFDRPSDSYLCAGTGHLFDVPAVEGQCLHCGVVRPGDQIQVVDIHSYAATPLALRAVELGRLTGLDASDIMFDADMRLNTQDFLELQAKREFMRMRRYGEAFGTVVLRFEVGDQEYKLFREWSSEAIRGLARLLVDELREVDLVARIGETKIGLLLVGSGAEGCEVVRSRVMAQLAKFRLTTDSGTEVSAVWEHIAWEQPEADFQEVLDFLQEA